MLVALVLAALGLLVIAILVGDEARPRAIEQGETFQVDDVEDLDELAKLRELSETGVRRRVADVLDESRFGRERYTDRPDVDP